MMLDFCCLLCFVCHLFFGVGCWLMVVGSCFWFGVRCLLFVVCESFVVIIFRGLLLLACCMLFVGVCWFCVLFAKC